MFQGVDVQGNGWKFNYIMASGIYYSSTRLDVSVSTFCIIHSHFYTRTINTHL